MLHLSSEQTGINGFQFMHTSYQRKNFIYYLADQSCKVLIASPMCPPSPREVISEGDKWPDGLIEKGGCSATHRIQENSNGSRIGPLTGLHSACAQQGVKL